MGSCTCKLDPRSMEVRPVVWWIQIRHPIPCISKIWRVKGSRYASKNTVKTVKHDKKVMVWGCLSKGGVGNLYRIHGIMVKEDYHNILQRQMFPSARALFPLNDFIFQQDNDPKHTAGINKAYLANKEVNLLDWPARSTSKSTVFAIFCHLVVICDELRQRLSNLIIIKVFSSPAGAATST
jgi:hypothetical protein